MAGRTSRPNKIPILATNIDERIMWFRRIRWAAAFALTLTFLAAKYFISPELFATPFLVAILASVTINLFLYIPNTGSRSISNQIGAVLILDTGILTYLLMNYGGHMNPFAMVYLVHVVIAALLVGQLWTWGVALLTISCYSALFLLSSSDHSHQMHEQASGAFDLHLHGMLLSFILISLLIAGFVSRMRAAIDKRDTALRETKASEQRLASLTTLAAGAAHELSTPLSTISLVMGELGANLPKNDLNLIKQELTRCKGILQRMSGQMLDFESDAFALTTSTELIAELWRSFSTDAHDLQIDSDEWESTLPKRGLLQSLESIIRNALKNSNRISAVRVSFSIKKEGLHCIVWNDGALIPEETLKRIGEPFFTTREPGEGMGLGVFLVKLFIAKHSGSFSIESALDNGTEVRIFLPNSAISKAANI